MKLLTADTVATFAPRVEDKAALADAINTNFKRFKIDSDLEAAHFLAQASHETRGFTVFTENLNYSAGRLPQVWSRFAENPEDDRNKRVPNALAFSVAMNPEKLANIVYANRLGNGAPETGDGWAYRGSGWFHLTGKYNFTEASKDIYSDDRLVKNPDLVRNDPEAQALTAGWFWWKNKLKPLALADDAEAVSKKVNGGTIGLDGRIKLARTIKEALGVA